MFDYDWKHEEEYIKRLKIPLSKISLSKKKWRENGEKTYYSSYQKRKLFFGNSINGKKLLMNVIARERNNSKPLEDTQGRIPNQNTVHIKGDFYLNAEDCHKIGYWLIAKSKLLEKEEEMERLREEKIKSGNDIGEEKNKEIEKIKSSFNKMMSETLFKFSYKFFDLFRDGKDFLDNFDTMVLFMGYDFDVLTYQQMKIFYHEILTKMKTYIEADHDKRKLLHSLDKDYYIFGEIYKNYENVPNLNIDNYPKFRIKHMKSRFNEIYNNVYEMISSLDKSNGFICSRNFINDGGFYEKINYKVKDHINKSNNEEYGKSRLEYYQIVRGKLRYDDFIYYEKFTDQIKWIGQIPDKAEFIRYVAKVPKSVIIK
jgi:hypothetical protein